MNLEKIQNEIVDLFDKNEDVFETFKTFEEAIGHRTKILNDTKIIKIMNYLCKKSRRVLIDFEIEKDYINTIGVNSAGLGTKSKWSSQLNNFGKGYSNERDKNTIKKILRIKDVFNKLIKIVNKNSVKDLRKLRAFYMKETPNIKAYKDFNIVRLKNKNSTEFLRMVFSHNGNITDTGFVNDEGNHDENYKYTDLHIADTKFKPEKIEELKMLSKTCITFNFRTLKIYAYLFKHKKEFKAEISRRIKLMDKETKYLERENAFLTKILNPIMAVENL